MGSEGLTDSQIETIGRLVTDNWLLEFMTGWTMGHEPYLVVKAGHRFKGWIVKPDGSTVNFNG